jgi:hypothetical protein
LSAVGPSRGALPERAVGARVGSSVPPHPPGLGIPAPYALPGAAGLLPFVAGAAGAWLVPSPDLGIVSYWLAGYAAVILAFVGALHWGVAMMDAAAPRGDQWLASLWSVTPALVGWAALQLPASIGLAVMAATFALQYAMDRRLARRHVVPPWFLPLRLRLTVVAVACLGVAAAA